MTVTPVAAAPAPVHPRWCARTGWCEEFGPGPIEFCATHRSARRVMTSEARGSSVAVWLEQFDEWFWDGTTDTGEPRIGVEVLEETSDYFGRVLLFFSADELVRIGAAVTELHAELVGRSHHPG